MLARILLLISLVASTSLSAEEKSKLDLDYFKITNNQILTDIMLDIEPKLVALYKKHNLKDVLIKQGARGIAKNLSEDKTYKLIIERIKGLSPDTLLEFLKLPKKDYPMLWAIGEGERLDRELASSLKLYKALHGKDYIENQL
jgi:hypothetical protein